MGMGARSPSGSRHGTIDVGTMPIMIGIDDGAAQGCGMGISTAAAEPAAGSLPNHFL